MKTSRKQLKEFFIKPKHDFLDLGCKTGGSIEWCQAHYGGVGLGVDMFPDYVYEANKRGFDAIVGDVLKLDFPPNSFRYISMMDFLEHLPDEKAVKQTLANCKKWASDFFFIHHPSFEDVEYLKKLGLKIDWTDWSGHTATLTIKDFERIFRDLGLKNYKIEKRKSITDSLDPHVVPLDAPTDTTVYSKKLGVKKKIVFDRPIYARVEMVVDIR